MTLPPNRIGYADLTPDKALLAFLEQYENDLGTEYMRIGCDLKITVLPEATEEDRKHLQDTMRVATANIFITIAPCSL